MSVPEPRLAAFVAAAPALDVAARAEALRLAGPVAAAPGRVLLSTCHRVEILVGDGEGLPGGAEAPLLAAGMLPLAGVEAARHVIALALGLESTVVGEDQVLHQLRSAVTDARARGPLGPDLGPLLDAALRAGRLGRSWRPTGADRPDRSLADAAVTRVEASIGGLPGRDVLVVGTGDMGRAAVHALLARGARVRIASRTRSAALSLAAETGAQVAAWDPGPALAAMDAVLVALAGPWTLSDGSAAVLASRPVVVDLSMPSALAPAVVRRLGDRLVDIDRLAISGPADRVAVRYRTRLDGLCERTLAAYLADLDARRTSAADRLAARIERQRTAGLDAYLRERPDLDADVREELDALTRDLSARLFREPLARLARDPDGRRRRALDELFDT